MEYFEIIKAAYQGYWNYLVDSIIHPGWNSYFWWLLGMSVAVWLLEIAFPWRKQQSIFRKDFWMDSFYMFFNFFLFSLIGYNALSDVGVKALSDFLGLFGVTNLLAEQVQSWPLWIHIIVVFLLADFIQWNVHRLLHRSPWLWQFHKLHHSVEEMGFAAHLRYHWMETIVYKAALFIPMTILGYGLLDLFVVHQATILIGHLNHANVNITWGPLKYVLNSPAMHIWHHADKMPSDKPYGINFGISLSIWDYLFGTAYVPHSGRDIKLGFDDFDQYPKTFWKQILYPFIKKQ